MLPQSVLPTYWSAIALIYEQAQPFKVAKLVICSAFCPDYQGKDLS